MSRPAIAERYPTSYFDMLDAFEHGRGELRIHYDDAGRAYDFRLDFYSFRSALEKEGALEMYPHAKILMLQVREDGNGGATVIITSRDKSEHAQAVSEALKK